MQSNTKSLIFPSRSASSPPVYQQAEDMQQAPISKKTAESASRTSLKRITLHLDHLTKLIMILKFPTMNKISTGKASIVMNSYQYPWQTTSRKPTKPKQLATSVRKMLSSSTYRLNIFHLFLQSLQVVKMEMSTVATEMAMDMQAFEIQLVVKTRMMFWKEMQKVVHRLRKQMMMCWSFLELSQWNSLLLLMISTDFIVSSFDSDRAASLPQNLIMQGEEDSSKMLEFIMGDELSMFKTLFPLIEQFYILWNQSKSRIDLNHWKNNAFFTLLSIIFIAMDPQSPQ